MCLICVDFQKELLTPLEARRILTEMAPDMTSDHLGEVIKMIEEKEDDLQSGGAHQVQPEKGVI